MMNNKQLTCYSLTCSFACESQEQMTEHELSHEKQNKQPLDKKDDKD